MERSRRLDDDALAEEIELYGDLVVAASEADGELSRGEIDRLLGLADEQTVVEPAAEHRGRAGADSAAGGRAAADGALP